MAFLGFGKRPRHRKFDYVPRFYDKDKEELKARIAQYKEGEESNTEAIKARIKGGFKKPISKSFETDEYKKALKRSNRIVILVALALIGLILYFLLNYFPKILQTFE